MICIMKMPLILGGFMVQIIYIGYCIFHASKVSNSLFVALTILKLELDQTD